MKMTEDMKTCLACGAEIGTVGYCSARPLIAMKDGGDRAPILHADPADAPCKACGVAVGGAHHLGCPLERCPACHGPLQRCGCMEGSNPAPEEITMIIKYTPEMDDFQVFGPMQDKIVCYGLLERARDVVQNWRPPVEGPGIIVSGGKGQ